MREFILLLYFDLLKIKNKIKEIFTTPKMLVKYIIGIAYFVGMAFVLFKGNHVNGNRDGIVTISKNAGLIANAVVLLGGTLIVLIALCVFTKDYTPSNFSISDVYYLFSTPISSKKILIYSVFKRAATYIWLSILMLSMVIFIMVTSFKLKYSSIALVLLGVLLVFMFLVVLGYLFFAIRVKYNLENKFKILHYIMLAMIALYIIGCVFLAYTYDFNIKNMLMMIGSDIAGYIPIVSSLVNSISLIYGNSMYPIIIDYVVIIGLIAGIYLIYINMDLNYYEYVSSKVEDNDQKIKAAKESKDIGLNSQLENNMKKVDITKKTKDYYGVLALYWKNSTTRKRRSTSIKKYLVYVLNIIVGVVGAYCTVTDSAIASILAIGIGTVYLSLCFSAMSELGRELRGLYIFLIPGKPIMKILAAMLDELITITLRISIMILPATFLSGKDIGFGLLVYITTISACVFLKLTNIIGVLISPKDKMEPPMLFMLFIMMIVAIPVGIGIGVFLLSDNMYFSVLAVLAVMISFIATVVFFCDGLFKRIEY